MRGGVNVPAFRGVGVWACAGLTVSLSKLSEDDSMSPFHEDKRVDLKDFPNLTLS